MVNIMPPPQNVHPPVILQDPNEVLFEREPVLLEGGDKVGERVAEVPPVALVADDDHAAAARRYHAPGHPCQVPNEAPVTVRVVRGNVGLFDRRVTELVLAQGSR